MPPHHCRSPSPPLPTFGIRALSKDSLSPGLISIRRSQYDATITSQPDAALQYLDDDDGVVVTVGSGLELAQRLEDPVLSTTSAVSRGSQRELVHIFDIERSAANLAHWRDHEAYSSKYLREQESHFIASSSSSKSAIATVDAAPNMEAHTDAEPVPAVDVVVPVTTVEPARPAQNDLLEGIDTHLNGLANVLQAAAETLRKAADKTRETDTSLIEDILSGVKGILTEVGSIGVEVYKEVTADRTDVEVVSIQSEDDAQDDESFEEAVEQAILGGVQEAVDQVVPDEVDAASIHAEVQSVSSIEDLSARNKSPEPDNESLSDDLKRWADAKFIYCGCGHGFYGDVALKSHTRRRLSDWCTPSDQPQVSADQKSVKNTSIAQDHDNVASLLPKRDSKVKFDLDKAVSEHVELLKLMNSDTPSAPVPSSLDSPDVCNLHKSSPWHADHHRTSHITPAVEDLCTPPTSSRSILDEPTEDPAFTARYPPLRSIRRAKSTIESRSVAGNRPAMTTAWPSQKMALNAILEPAIMPRLSRPLERNSEAFDASRKPLPGAWPDLKPESSTTESSGAFFNRMTGRNNAGLQRSNTTASSNPASRLTGPFDPGFPYHVNSQYQTKRWSTRSLRAPPRLSLGSPEQTVTQRPTAPPAPEHSTRPVNNIPAFKSVYRPYRPEAPKPSMRHHRSVPAFNSVSNAEPGVPHAWRPTMPSPFVPKPAASGPGFASFATCSRSKPYPAYTSQSNAPSVISAPSQEELPLRVPGSFDPPVRPAARESIEDYSGPGSKSKFDECVEFLKLCGFGIEDDNLRDRLYVYAVAADGNVETAVEMIEEDRQVSKNLNTIE